MSEKNLVRRQFMKTALAVGVTGAVTGKQAVAAGSGDSDFAYEVVRTEAEWKSMFDMETYKVLREGDTEWPRSSRLWNDYSDGEFACVGCDLKNYTSVWRVELDKGWVFFSQSEPNALLMGIDGEPPQGMADDKLRATIEVHCRRCGSHMGHVLKVENRVVHCINGSALKFTAA